MAKGSPDSSDFWLSRSDGRAEGRCSFPSLTGRVIDGEGRLSCFGACACLCARKSPSPSRSFGPIHLSPTPWGRGNANRRYPRTSSSPRPAFAVWPFQRTLPAAVGEVGKRGTGPSLSIVSTWRGLPCPAGVLALPEGTQRTARPRSGPGPQGSSPSTPPPRAEPAPSPSTRIRFMTRVPARVMRGLCGRFWGRGENCPIIFRSSEINGLAEKYIHAEHCVWSAMGWRRHARRNVFVE